jgi:hypothetical protein
LLQFFVRRPLAEAVYEELRVEDVLAGRTYHRSGSGDAI